MQNNHERNFFLVYRSTKVQSSTSVHEVTNVYSSLLNPKLKVRNSFFHFVFQDMIQGPPKLPQGIKKRGEHQSPYVFSTNAHCSFCASGMLHPPATTPSIHPTSSLPTTWKRSTEVQYRDVFCFLYCSSHSRRSLPIRAVTTFVDSTKGSRRPPHRHWTQSYSAYDHFSITLHNFFIAFLTCLRVLQNSLKESI